MEQQNMELVKSLKFTNKNNCDIFVLEDLDKLFTIKRIFYIYCQKGNFGGKHANINTNTIFICASGRVKLELDDGSLKEIFELNQGEAVIINKKVWRTYTALEDSMVICAVDFNYDKNEYITDYKIFKEKYGKI